MKREIPDEIEHDIERTRSEMSQTLQAIERKLSPRQLMEDAMESVREAASGQSSLGRVVRENPVPLALLGVGVGWLMISSMRSSRDQTSFDTYGAEDIGGEVGEAGYAASGYTSAATYGADLSGEYGEAGYAGEASSSTLGGGNGSGVAERARQKLTDAQERAGRLASQAQRRAEDLTGSMRRQADEVAWRSRQMFRDHPLMMGIMAVMVGAALGAALPRTRREEELVGGASRDLLKSAQQAGSDIARKAERVVGRAAEAAREEGSEQLRRETGESGTTGTETPSSRLTH